LLPKNSKHFIQPTADELNYDKTIVEDVISFFYEDVRRTLVEMRGPNIQVENLGSFKVRNNKIPRLINKYEQYLNTLDKKEFSQVAIIRSVEKRLEKTLRLKKIMDEETQRKKDHLKIKDEYIRKNLGK